MPDSGAWVPHAVLGWDPIWVSTAVLAFTYALIVAERLNRALLALLGAGLMIQLGVLNQAEAVKGIDFNTIALLTGMMVLVATARRSGLFQCIALYAARAARAKPWALLALLSVTTALLSALLDNVTTVLLVVPVTIAVTRQLGVEPYPFLFGEVFASNIGGAATLIGDPPNILIGSAVGLSFNDFILHLTPVISLVLVVQTVAMHLVWGRRLHATHEARTHVLALRPLAAIEDWRLLWQSLAVLACVTLAFVFSRPLHLEPGTVAMFGSAVLLTLDTYTHHAERQTEKVTGTFNEVDWITIFFFVGLFVIVRGIEVAGVLRLVADRLIAVTGGDLARTGYVVLWMSALLSAIVDNIPFVATMVPLLKTLGPTLGGSAAIGPLWWCLSLGACLGGNGTLVGASANLTVAGLAERSGVPFRFSTYLGYAFPMMLLSILVAHLYVWLRYFR
ncbi:MAG: ArsB/NhaD family transporter [Vicinamibacterales bacterium]